MDNVPDIPREVILQPAEESESSEDDLLNELNNSSSDSSDDSSSSSDSDREGAVQDIINGDENNAVLFPLLRMILHGRRRPKVEGYLNVVHAKSDDQFRNDYRLTRDTAYNMIGAASLFNMEPDAYMSIGIFEDVVSGFVLDRLHNSGFIPVHDFGRPKTSAELSFLLFLRFVSNNDPHRTIAELFDVSESSVFRIIRRVIEWIITLVPDYIKWPRENEARRVRARFAEIRDDFPGCMGAVDGSHIRIIKPSIENSRDFYNRKSYYSINLTAIADADRRFLMVNCGQPGCRHDVRVFRESDFHEDVEANRYDYFPVGSFILGDAAYAGINPAWIIYPYRDNGRLTVNQTIFNTRLSKLRVVIEHAFGILKGRFRRLLHQINLFDLPFVVDIIVACCVLHNVCIHDGDDGEDFRIDDPGNVIADVLNGEGGERLDGPDARSRIFGQMFAIPEDNEGDDI